MNDDTDAFFLGPVLTRESHWISIQGSWLKIENLVMFGLIVFMTFSDEVFVKFRMMGFFGYKVIFFPYQRMV